MTKNEGGSDFSRLVAGAGELEPEHEFSLIVPTEKSVRIVTTDVTAMHE